jgi:hypothetical protein
MEKLYQDVYAQVFVREFLRLRREHFCEPMPAGIGATKEARMAAEAAVLNFSSSTQDKVMHTSSAVA